MSARNFVSVCFLASLAAVISACSSSPPRNDSAVVSAPAYSNVSQFGYVSGIDVVPVATRTTGGGAVLGAVLGAVIGHQVGSGRGRDAATGVGVVGGAVIGNQIEKRNKADNEIYRVSVRMDNGNTSQFDYQRIDDLRVGDRVKVEGGQLHRD
jgi:outer membrane lipoprotein SlyB